MSVSLPLRISVPALQTSKVLKFDARMTVKEAIALVLDKVPECQKQGEHGLFMGADNISTGKWLKEDKPLVFYDLKQNDALEFRKKNRMLKVKLLDDSTKTILVDESVPVSELVKSVGKKIGIDNTEEFSLKVEGTGDAEWLNPNVSLFEQNVKPEDLVVLKKKFFFSDGNIDTSDPVQLHLLYVQAVKQIVSGEHQASYDEIVQLAGLQMQANYGNHNPNKHKPGFCNLEQFMPPAMAKIRNIEKDILAEHKKLSGLSDLNAKMRYVQTCRQLKTYGITFFNVKEKVKGQKKPVPRLLGVTRDSIMRMDPETKAVIGNYPLTHLRRWAANPGTFTLDFGDYEDSYHTVLTDEGDAISQLIAGYIDIILQKRREAALGRRGPGDEVFLAEEKDVSAQKGTAITTSVAPTSQGMFATFGDASQFAQMGGGAMIGSIGETGMQGQQAAVLGELDGLLSNLSSQAANLQGYQTGDSEMDAAMAAIMGAAAELAGTPGDTARFNAIFGSEDAAAHMAVFCEQIASAAAIMCSTKDPEQMMLAAQKISAACAQLVAAAKAAAPGIGAKDPAAQQRLIEAARLVANATGKLVSASNAKDHAQMVAAAREIAAATAALISAADTKNLPATAKAGPSAQQSQAIIDATKAVADATTRLMATAKSTAATADAASAERVVDAARMTANATAELVQAAKIAADRIAMGINDPKAQQDLLNAAKQLGMTVASLVQATQSAATASGKANPATQQLLAFAAKNVADSIAMLVAASKAAAASIPQNTARAEFLEAKRTIEAANVQLLNQLGPNGTANGLVQAAKAVAAASTTLVTSARTNANRTLDEDRKRGLQDGAQVIGDSTSNLVGAVKNAAGNMNDEAFKTAVRESAENLNNGAQKLLDEQVKHDLMDAAKEFTEATTQLIGSAKMAAAKASPGSQQQFIQDAKPMAEAVAALMAAKGATNDPDYLGNLVAAAKQATLAANNLITSAKDVSVTSADVGAAQKLDQSISVANAATGKLMQTAKAAGSDQKDLDDIVRALIDVASSAVDSISNIKKTPQDFMEAARNAAMNAGELVQIAEMKCRGVTDPEYRDAVNIASKSVATCIGALIPACKNALQNPSDKDVQNEVTVATKQLSMAMSNLIQTSKTAFDPTIPTRSVMLAYEAVTAALDISANSVPALADSTLLPGDVAQAAADLAKATSDTIMGLEDGPEAVLLNVKNAGLASAKLNEAVTKQANGMNNAILQQQLKDAARAVTAATVAMVTAAKTKGNDKHSQEKLIQSAHDVLTNSNQLVGASKISSAIAPLEAKLAAIPTTQTAYKTEVYKTAQDLFDSLPGVLEATDQNSLIAAARSLAAAATALSNAAKSGADQCHDTVAQQQLLDAAKAVSEGTAKLIQNAKSGLTNPADKIAAQKAAKDLKNAAASAKVAVDAASANSPAEILVSHAKAVLNNTVRLVSAEGDQDEVLSSSKQVATSSAKLGASGRNMAAVTLEESLQSDLFDGCAELAESTGNVVGLSRQVLKDANAQAKLVHAAHALVTATGRIVTSGTAAGAVSTEEEGEDEAEKELINAAKAMEQLSGRIIQADTASLGEREAEMAAQVVEFAKAIAAACGSLLSAGRASQREIAQMRKAQPTNTYYSKDPSVQEGLIGSSKAVVQAASMLIDASNETAKGKLSDTKMIASAQSLGASTAQLVAASRVKAKPGSKNQEKLQSAAKTVQNATNSLVKAVQKQTEQEQIQANIFDPNSYADAKKREIEAKMKVLELEKMLAAARNEVQQVYKSNYADSGTASGIEKPKVAPPPKPT